jgi:hypothetical protein
LRKARLDGNRYWRRAGGFLSASAKARLGLEGDDLCHRLRVERKGHPGPRSNLKHSSTEASEQMLSPLSYLLALASGHKALVDAGEEWVVDTVVSGHREGAYKDEATAGSVGAALSLGAALGQRLLGLSALEPLADVSTQSRLTEETPVRQRALA